MGGVTMRSEVTSWTSLPSAWVQDKARICTRLFWSPSLVMVTVAAGCLSERSMRTVLTLICPAQSPEGAETARQAPISRLPNDLRIMSTLPRRRGSVGQGHRHAVGVVAGRDGLQRRDAAI